VDGIPYIALKLLPKLAPELWGSEENFLDAVGLFIDERQKSFPVARGIGFSGLSRDEAQSNIDYASFTCGACHIGRVRLESGQMDYLDGGVNTTFNIALFRVKLYQTLQKAYSGETGDNKYKLLTQKLLSALDATHRQNPITFITIFSLPTKALMLTTKLHKSRFSRKTPNKPSSSLHSVQKASMKVLVL